MSTQPKLRQSIFEVDEGIVLDVPAEDMRLFIQYIDEREENYRRAATTLRDKDEALAYCERLKLSVKMTSTKLEGWTDSPKALIAAVTNIAKLTCEAKGVSLVEHPHKRCVWLNEIIFMYRQGTSTVPSRLSLNPRSCGKSRNIGEGAKERQAAAR